MAAWMLAMVASSTANVVRDWAATLLGRPMRGPAPAPMIASDAASRISFFTRRSLLNHRAWGPALAGPTPTVTFTVGPPEGGPHVLQKTGLARQEIIQLDDDLSVGGLEHVGWQPGLLQVVVDDVEVAAGAVDEVEPHAVGHFVRQRIVLRQAAEGRARRHRVVHAQNAQVRDEIAE